MILVDDLMNIQLLADAILHVMHTAGILVALLKANTSVTLQLCMAIFLLYCVTISLDERHSLMFKWQHLRVLHSVTN